jgi:hypothetical protein
VAKSAKSRVHANAIQGAGLIRCCMSSDSSRANARCRIIARCCGFIAGNRSRLAASRCVSAVSRADLLANDLPALSKYAIGTGAGNGVRGTVEFGLALWSLSGDSRDMTRDGEGREFAIKANSTLTVMDGGFFFGPSTFGLAPSARCSVCWVGPCAAPVAESCEFLFECGGLPCLCTYEAQRSLKSGASRTAAASIITNTSALAMSRFVGSNCTLFRRRSPSNDGLIGLKTSEVLLAGGLFIVDSI